MTALAWTAVFTGILAAGAIVTAIFAIRAFRKQAEEVSTIERQALDQQELTRQQGELLTVQSMQLELQRQQAEDQRKVSVKQLAVLELQAAELSESLAERKRLGEEQRRAQAAQVAAWFGLRHVPAQGPAIAHYEWGAFIRNESALPILSVRVFFNYIQAETTVSEDWSPVMRGGPVSMIRVLPPRSEQFVEIPDSVRKMIDQCDESIYAVSMNFMDAAGVRWERDARGALNER